MSRLLLIALGLLISTEALASKKKKKPSSAENAPAEAKSEPQAAPTPAASPASALPAQSEASGSKTKTLPDGSTVRELKAQMVEEPAPPSGGAVAAPPAAAPVTPEPKLGIRAAVRLGALLPRTELGTGFSVAAEAGYALPVLERRLLVLLGSGYALSPFQGPRLVPGRGYDPNFVQNTTLVPVTLEARFLQPIGATGASAGGGAGFTALYARAQFESFGQSQETAAWGFGPTVHACFDYALGPGRIAADVRFTEVRADILPTQVPVPGQDSLGHFTFSAGYALTF